MAASKNYSQKVSVKTPKLSAKINPDDRKKALAAIIKGIQASASRIESYLPPLLDKAMESSVWDWPRMTKRQNGSTAGSPRNIVDTGELKKSLKVTTKFLKTKTTFNIAYTASYAVFVHEGGYVRPYGNPRARAVYTPGRPWVTAALEGRTAGIEGIDLQAQFLSGLPSAW